MAVDRYSWDTESTQRDDPWAALRPSFGQPGAEENHAYQTPAFQPVSNPAAPQRQAPSASRPADDPGETTYVPSTPAAPPTPQRQAPSVDRGIPKSQMTGTAQVPGGDYTSWFMSLVNGKRPSPRELAALEPQLAQYGITILKNARGWADKIQLPNGQSFDVIEAATADGGKRWQMLADSGDVDGTARALTSSLTGDGHSVTSDGYNRLMIDGRPYTIAAAPKNPTWKGTFEGQQPYTPGAITMDDLDGLGYQDVAARLKTGVTDSTDDLVMSILQNPESLSDQMVDTLKARNADELADVATADEQDLLRFGFANGLDESNWLQSERLAGRRERDRALIAGNRDIDVKASETRVADRRAAAELGSAHSGEQRQREALASDTALRTAAQTGDRMALRESIAQKAAELQLDQDELMQQYVVAQMEDLTRRWGIEVQADIDLTRLAQQSQEFREDLAFKLAALDQEMTYNYDRLEFDYTSDTLNREERARRGSGGS